jgi:leader peptidase (prepilin peptidase)/N-methyltransferase
MMSLGPLVLAGAPLGACLGSFVSTAALRAASGEQFLRGRSHCDSCQMALPLSRTVPILSFAVLGGHCERCGEKIDRAHLVGEVAGALIVATAFAAAEPARAALLAVLGLGLLAAAIFDAKTQRLLDGLTLSIAAVGVTLAAESSWMRLAVGACAAIAAFALLETLRRGFIVLRGRQGLGFGDVKLIAALAFWLGAATPWMVGGAAIVGLGVAAVARPGDGRIPFGPPIAVSAWIAGLAAEAGLWPILG